MLMLRSRKPALVKHSPGTPHPTAQGRNHPLSGERKRETQKGRSGQNWRPWVDCCGPVVRDWGPGAAGEGSGLKGWRNLVPGHVAVSFLLAVTEISLRRLLLL